MKKTDTFFLLIIFSMAVLLTYSLSEVSAQPYPTTHPLLDSPGDGFAVNHPRLVGTLRFHSAIAGLIKRTL